MKTKNKAESLIKTVEDILEKETKGLKYKELEKIIKEKNPDLLVTFYNIRPIIKKYDTQIFQSKKGGPYYHKKFSKIEDDDFTPYEEEKTKKSKKLTEKDFYLPIAKYLIELGDCDKAVPLGGTSDKRKKWYTPDVLGIRKSDIKDTIKFDPEIVSAEVKIETTESPMVGFGQAISYRLFSAKVYLFEPHSFKDNPEFDRIEALCLLFGIGLILFDDKAARKLKFEIRARAQSAKPELTWSNYFLRNTNENILKGLF